MMVGRGSFVVCEAGKRFLVPKVTDKVEMASLETSAAFMNNRASVLLINEASAPGFLWLARSW